MQPLSPPCDTEAARGCEVSTIRSNNKNNRTKAVPNPPEEHCSRDPACGRVRPFDLGQAKVEERSSFEIINTNKVDYVIFL